MNKMKAKHQALKRRHRRGRDQLRGTPERPRLRVTRTNKHIYAQVIDDVDAKTICSCSSLDAEFKQNPDVHGGNREGAKLVGQLIAKRALEKGVKQVRFDRGGRIYHGRVQALADGARESGLEF